MNKLKLTFLSTSILTFGISLFQNCFCTNDCQNSFSVLIFGILSVVGGGINLCSLANPLLLASWTSFYLNTKVSFVASLAACALSLTFLFATKVAIHEAGTPRQIKKLELGYWLWLSSSFIILIGNSSSLYLKYSKSKNIS